MAFKDVNERGDIVKSSEMEVGSSLVGYVTGFQEGPYGENLQMKVDGKDTLVFTSGSLKWAVKDRKVSLGFLTKITRLPDEKIKGAKGSISKTIFKIEQDPEDAIAVTARASAPRNDKQTTDDELNKLKAKGA